MALIATGLVAQTWQNCFSSEDFASETEKSHNFCNLTDSIPRLLEVLGRLEAIHRDSVKSMSKLFLHICRTFGKTFTDSKVRPVFFFPLQTHPVSSVDEPCGNPLSLDFI